MATFVEQQVTRLEAILAANVGVSQVTVGNTMVAYDDLLKQYDYWKSKVARQQGARPRAMTMNLRNF